MEVQKVKLIRIKDNQPVEKSLVNWKNLSAKDKAAYRVVDGTDNPVTEKTVSIPEEVQLLRKKKIITDESEGTAEKEVIDSEKGKSASDAVELTTEQKIVAAYDTLEGTYEERRKKLANDYGQHWRSIDKILTDARKK